MSTCISRAGEFGAHDTTEGNYICDRCGVLDEDGIYTELYALRARVARVEALADEWEEGSDEPPYPDTFYGIRLRAALSGPEGSDDE